MNRTWDRMVQGIMSLGYVIASVILVFVALGWTSPLLYASNYLITSINNWILGITGTIIFAVTLTILISSFRSIPDKMTAIHETALGKVHITIPALEHLVIKAAKSVQGIREVKPFLRGTAEGLDVELRIQVSPDINIPHVTESLQKNVKEYVLKTAGLSISEIKVFVNKISYDIKNRVE